MNDFNTQLGQRNGHKAEVLMLIQSQDLVSLYRIGCTKEATAFGRARDTRRNDLKDPNSVAG